MSSAFLPLLPIGFAILLLRSMVPGVHAMLPEGAIMRARRQQTPYLHPDRHAFETSIFCYTVVSRRYEAKLLLLHWMYGLGVFGCSEYQIFSNFTADQLFPTSPEAASSVRISLINASLEVSVDLNVENAGMFQRLWKRIFLEKRYRRHDWMAKLDVDAVVFPSMLRQTLSRRCPRNCHPRHMRQDYQHLEGLHRYRLKEVLTDSSAMFGPLEVMTHSAVLTFAEGFWKCQFEARERHRFSHVPEVFNLWGADNWVNIEDIWVERCMFRLGIDGITERKFLSEGFGKRQQPCEPGFVAYHPYKDLRSHLRCLFNVTSFVLESDRQRSLKEGQ
eukprot:TRINITY_DN28616_c0_g1_i1.p1 TRINITY_DN28616_c0_g1~~TRINITY_DN28616_c0_g1_i1.p1  ORF type:complete len:332 (+),score=43.04 TRINITY_DN28616_c0_g1_i1:116-1111(+)